MEKERETLMLDNIKDSIKNTIIQQHKENLKIDKKIDKINIDKKADEVSSVITEHIIKGNEFKILHLPYNPTEENDEENEDSNLALELRKESAKVNERYKALPAQEKQILIDKYTIKSDILKE